MSDACFVEFSCRRKDLEKVQKVLEGLSYKKEFWDDDDSPDEESSLMTFSILGADYGWSKEAAALAKAGLPFLIFHSAGGGYGAGVAACYEGSLVWVNADVDGNPCCPVYEDGIGKNYLEQCNLYWELRKKVENV